jgi:predicted aspartyl protease
MPSLTWTEADLARSGPLVEVSIGPPSVLARALTEISSDIQLALPIRTTALVDTGAEFTVINQALIDRLEIPEIDTVFIAVPTLAEPIECLKYVVDLNFSEDVTLADVVVISAPMKHQKHTCLVGRNVLRHALLTYMGHINQFTLSF